MADSREVTDQSAFVKELMVEINKLLVSKKVTAGTAVDALINLIIEACHQKEASEKFRASIVAYLGASIVEILKRDI